MLGDAPWHQLTVVSIHVGVYDIGGYLIGGPHFKGVPYYLGQGSRTMGNPHVAFIIL